MVRTLLALRSGRPGGRNRALRLHTQYPRGCGATGLGEKVLEKLLPEVVGAKRVVMFAGHRYREFLIEPLERRGAKVEMPMAHLARGEQLAWLLEH